MQFLQKMVKNQTAFKSNDLSTNLNLTTQKYILLKKTLSLTRYFVGLALRTRTQAASVQKAWPKDDVLMRSKLYDSVAYTALWMLIVMSSIAQADSIPPEDSLVG